LTLSPLNVQVAANGSPAQPKLSVSEKVDGELIERVIVALPLAGTLTELGVASRLNSCDAGADTTDAVEAEVAYTESPE
jgi:hypothetical protein